MKVTSFLLFLIASLTLTAQNRFCEYKGAYFTQGIPPEHPLLFAHDLLANSINIVFTPDGNEFFFVKDVDSNNTGDILWMKKINNKWTKPVTAAFNSKYSDNDICVSPDGQTVYFRSWRPVKGKSLKESASHIWSSKKAKDNWSEPRPVKYEEGHLQAGYPSVAISGNLYFPKKKDLIKRYGDLFYLKKVDGKFKSIVALKNDPLNVYNEGDMCVSPDESFVITSCWERPDTVTGGKSDLYISFKLKDGSWSELMNMGPKINSNMMENCPTLSPDGKIFFFNRYDGRNGYAYWVSSKIIDKLKQKIVYKN